MTPPSPPSIRLDRRGHSTLASYSRSGCIRRIRSHDYCRGSRGFRAMPRRSTLNSPFQQTLPWSSIFMLVLNSGRLTCDIRVIKGSLMEGHIYYIRACRSRNLRVRVVCIPFPVHTKYLFSWGLLLLLPLPVLPFGIIGDHGIRFQSIERRFDYRQHSGRRVCPCRVRQSV